MKRLTERRTLCSPAACSGRLSAMSDVEEGEIEGELGILGALASCYSRMRANASLRVLPTTLAAPCAEPAAPELPQVAPDEAVDGGNSRECLLATKPCGRCAAAAAAAAQCQPLGTLQPVLVPAVASGAEHDMPPLTCGCPLLGFLLVWHSR